jgi:predicted TIM-barrel enzyme
LQQFKDQIDNGIPIIGAGTGTGISAKFEEAGGVDLIVFVQLRALPDGWERFISRVVSIC